MARQDEKTGPGSGPIQIDDSYLPNFPNATVMVQIYEDAALTTPALPQGSIKIEYLPAGLDTWQEATDSPAQTDRPVIRRPTFPVKGIRITPTGIDTHYLRVSYVALDAYLPELPQTPSDSFGNAARSTLTQEFLVAERFDFINVQFQYNLPINDDSSDIVGSVEGDSTLEHENSMAKVTSGAGTGRASLASRDSIRYYPGHEFAAEMTAFVSQPPAEGNAYWGIGDLNGLGDAMAFGYQGPTFGVFLRRAGIETFVPKSEFTHGSGVQVDPTKMNLWVFRGGWYGILPLQFGVFYKGKYVLLHELDNTNKTTEPHLSNPTLPMFAECLPAASDTGYSVYTASWRGGVSGSLPKGSKADRTQTVEVSGKAVQASNVLTPIITLRNVETFQGKVNHVRVRYGTVALSVDGTKSVVWEVHKNATLTGASFTPKNADTSVVEYDTSATAMTVNSDNIGGTIMGKVSTTRINLFEGDVILAVYPGETITLAARSANSSTADVFFRWIEEF